MDDKTIVPFPLSIQCIASTEVLATTAYIKIIVANVYRRKAGVTFLLSVSCVPCLQQDVFPHMCSRRQWGTYIQHNHRHNNDKAPTIVALDQKKGGPSEQAVGMLSAVSMVDNTDNHQYKRSTTGSSKPVAWAPICAINWTLTKE